MAYRSPHNKAGHGTHTSSIIGSWRVKNVAGLGSLAGGTASGGASLVHLAMYKTCWPVPGKEVRDECLDEDILAAIDDAVGDGVHVLSTSIGGNPTMPYTKDGIAIGSLHTTKSNIVVACAAGNDGPAPLTMSNPAPWIITVGASSVDHVFPAPPLLGNGIKSRDKQ